MTEIEFKGGAACLHRDKDEKIDPDKDFSHIDKRIQDVLGQYQKDFMGEVSADNLGARWGGYGSFLPVDLNIPIPTHTRPQTHIISRSPRNPAEVCQNSTVQTNELVAPRPGNLPLSGKATASDNAVDVRSSRVAFLNNKPKVVSANESDKSLPKVQLKVGTEKGIDNSAIYSGLGLDDSPSSTFGDSPSEADAKPPCAQEFSEMSPSYVIKVMTTFPVPDGNLLSPLPDNLLSFTSAEISLKQSSPQEIIKTEHESISSEEKMNVRKENKLKQISENQVIKLDRKNCKYPMNVIGQCSKRVEESILSKGREVILDIPATSADMPVDRKESSNMVHKDNVPSISFPSSERDIVGQLVDVGPKLQKQSHVRQGASIVKVDSFASPAISVEGNCNTHGSKEKVQRDKNGTPILKSTGLSQIGYMEQNSNKSTEQKVKKKAKEEFEDLVSLRGAEMQSSRTTQENTDKCTKQEKKMKSKANSGLDFALQEATGAYHERTDMSAEKINNGRKVMAKRNVLVEKDTEDKKKHGIEDSLEAMKDLGQATAEPITESSSEKKVPQSRIKANLSIRKEHPSSEGKKKTRKSQDGSQLTASLPKVSFRVGSSSALSSQQADCRSSSISQGETHKEVKEERDISHSDMAGKKILKKKDSSHQNVSGKAILKKKEVTDSKDSIVGVARREQDASGSKLKDKSEDKRSQYLSNIGSNPRQDLPSSSNLIETAHTSDALLTGSAPLAVIQDVWAQCDQCQTWRLLPHNIKPDDLPKSWLCSMQTWLPGMNKCSFTEEETKEALLALYQPQPLANGAQIQQSTGVSQPVATADAQIRSASVSTTCLDVFPGAGNRRPKEEIYVNSKKDQPCTSASGSIQRLSKSKTASTKPVVIGKKREGSRDVDVVHKKVKRDHRYSATGLEHTVPLATEIRDTSISHNLLPFEGSKDHLMKNSNVSKQFKEKTQKPADASEDERKDVSARRRKLKDWQTALGTEIPSSQVPFEETGSDSRKVKRQKLKESYFPEKESSTSRANDKNEAGSSGKVDRQNCDRNMSQKTDDCKKSSGSGLELKMPALVAATSSSSKVSNTCRLKMKSNAKCSPAGSISSSPFKASRSDHDRSGNQVSTPNAEQQLPLVKKKNLEARIVAMESGPHREERTEGKAKRGKDSGFQPCSVQEDVKKLSAVKHVNEHRKEKQLKLKSYESKEKQTDFKEEGYSLPHKLPSTDLGVRSSNVMCSNKPKSDDILPERVKSKRYQVGSSRDNPSSSTQDLEFEKADGRKYVETHDNKGKLPKLPGCSDLRPGDAGAPSSGRKVLSDHAATTALREATDLKHLADRLKANDKVNSSKVLFQAALKFLQWASLAESGNSEVYISTAKLCHYCGLEFEKLNDMASAALAYKCEEVAYMRVVYAGNVSANRDRVELQSALTVPQVESPSSSASDVDNMNNPIPNDAVKSTHSSAAHGNYIISAGIRPSFVHLLDFAQYVNLAMDTARKSQAAFAAARVTLGEAGNEEGISSIKTVLDFSFHDVGEFLHLVRLAMEAFSPGD